MRAPLVPSLLVALGAVCFSLMGLFVKLSDRFADTSTFSLLAVRCALGLVLNLFAVAAHLGFAAAGGSGFVTHPASGGPTDGASGRCGCPSSARACMWLTVRALGGFGCIVLEYMALKELPLATNSMIVYSSPAFIVLWAALLLGERVRPHVIACLGVSFVGLLLIVEPWRSHGEAPLWAYAAALVSAIGAGLVYVALGELKEVSYRVVLNVFLSSCLVLSSMTGAALGRLPVPPPSSPAWVYLLAVGLWAYAAEVCITLGFARARGGLGQVAVLKFLSPIFSVLWGVVFLSEAPTLLEGVGAALVLGASAVILHTKSGHVEDEEEHKDQVSQSTAAESTSPLSSSQDQEHRLGEL